MAFRIDPNQRLSPGTLDTQNSVEKSTLGFGPALDQVQRLQKKEFQDFLAHLDILGQKLAHSLSLADLAEFKTRVKGFLRSTLGQSRRLQEETHWDFRGRPKVFARVTQIDAALEALGRTVLAEQAKPLDVLAKIDEIRGLVVDLFA